MISQFPANTAAIALIAADSGIITTEARDWATGQIDYMLGNNPMGISYVIGYTDKFPQKPHHRGAYVSYPLLYHNVIYISN